MDTNRTNLESLRRDILEYVTNSEYKLPFEYYYGYTIYDKQYIKHADIYVLKVLFNNKKWVYSFSMSDDILLDAVEKFFELPNLETKPFQL